MLFFRFLLFFLLIHFNWGLSPQPLVLIVSYDAFRYNYIDKGVTPTLAKLKAEGCSAEYLENVFITKTFPNHVSIATGLFAESHGVMGNFFYDPELKKPLYYSYELFHQTDKISPIWIENERRGGGRHSGMMMWPGNNFNYTGLAPTFYQPFNEKLPWKQRVDTALSWFQHPTTPTNLVMMYLEEPDGHGHAFGPDSEEGINTLRTMETITKYILEKLEKANLRNKVNLFFISDHGMQSVTKKDILDLRPFVNESFYDTYELSPTLHVYPKKGKSKEVYEGLMRAVKALGGFSVYRPQELPARWHYANNRRTPPILLVADPPHVFHDFYEMIAMHEKKFNFTASDNHTFGVHGYDYTVDTMRPYFIATGPGINAQTQVPPFRTVDLFSVWAQLLGFPEAGAATNGSSLPAQKILKTQHHVVVAKAAMRSVLRVAMRKPYLYPSNMLYTEFDVPTLTQTYAKQLIYFRILNQQQGIAAGIIGGILVVLAMAITVYFVHRKLQFKYHRLLQNDVPAHDSSRQRLLDSEEEEA